MKNSFRLSYHFTQSTKCHYFKLNRKIIIIYSFSRLQYKYSMLDERYCFFCTIYNVAFTLSNPGTVNLGQRYPAFWCHLLSQQIFGEVESRLSYRLPSQFDDDKYGCCGFEASPFFVWNAIKSQSGLGDPGAVSTKVLGQF